VIAEDAAPSWTRTGVASRPPQLQLDPRVLEASTRGRGKVIHDPTHRTLDYGSLVSGDRLADAYIGSAATDIAGHGRVNVRVLGLRDRIEQRRRRHDLARLAVSALDDLQLQPSLLQLRTIRRRANTLDSGDRSSTDRAYWQQAGAYRLPVQVHRARDAAAELRPRETDQSRSTHSSGMSSGASIAVVLPLILRLIIVASAAQPNEKSKCGLRGPQPGRIGGGFELPCVIRADAAVLRDSTILSDGAGTSITPSFNGVGCGAPVRCR
jgi:hypothetical protein